MSAVSVTRSASPTRRLLHSPLALVAGGWLVLVIVAALLAPVLAPLGPDAQNLAAIKQLPSAAHPLGTDSLGRDLFARILAGALPAMLGAVEATLVAAVLGIALGVPAGYLGGRFAAVVERFVTLVIALPTIVVLLSLMAVFARDQQVAMAVVGIMGSARVVRVARGAVLTMRQEPYLIVSRLSGLSELRIMQRHVLPSIAGPLITQLTLFASTAFSIQAGLAFLGMGAAPPAVSWGGLIADAGASFIDFPWMLVPTGGILASVVLACSLLGDAIRQEARAAFVGGSSGSGARARRRRGAEACPASDAELPPVRSRTPDRAQGGVLVLDGLDVVTAAQGQPVCLGIDLTLAPGEIVGLLGESGSGKSSVAMALLGLLPDGLRASAGSLTVPDGRVVRLGTERYPAGVRGRAITAVFQDPVGSLDPSFTVRQQLSEVLRTHRPTTKRQAAETIAKALHDVRIDDVDRVLSSYPHQLSGGMAQRIAIARALLPEPAVLIADEPTTALDVTVQAEVLELLREIVRARGLALLVITHDRGVVADLCERAVILRDGRIVEQGTVQELYDAVPLAPGTAAPEGVNA